MECKIKCQLIFIEGTKKTGKYVTSIENPTTTYTEHLSDGSRYYQVAFVAELLSVVCVRIICGTTFF